GIPDPVKTRSLSGRIALLTGTATVLFLGAAALLMDHMVDTDMSRRFDDNLLSQARTLAALVDTAPGHVVIGGAARFRPRLLASEAPAAYAIHCAGSGTAYSAPTPQRLPPDWAGQARRHPSFADVGSGDQAQRAVWFSFRADGFASGDDAADARATGDCQ